MKYNIEVELVDPLEVELIDRLPPVFSMEEIPVAVSIDPTVDMTTSMEASQEGFCKRHRTTLCFKIIAVIICIIIVSTAVVLILVFSKSRNNVTPSLSPSLEPSLHPSPSLRPTAIVIETLDDF